MASWYGAKYHGRPTSSGEIYNRHKLTAAHNELPLGSKVRVTNVATGESVVVKINDRGPFSGARIIDLSEAAARRINYRRSGLAKVTVEVIGLPASFLASRAKRKASEEAMAAAVPAKLAPTASLVVPAKLGSVSAISVTSSVTPTLAQTQFFAVQAGSFQNLDNAEDQVEKLRRIDQKMPIALVEESVNGQTVHRVLVGRFVSQATAEQARKDLGRKARKGVVRPVMAEPTLLASAVPAA
ncbi:septal ring lytic transglycosylase RlpA family protein [Rufibacter sp. XAAS-G3-1]|uniref:septal ring lytic transglycosylase RlpA family protein n=1 Tax=Rufibacter sp. XAAS-G3-1 TaxID=2729134 RepID=UPI0015E694F3|nr:septal ring lytic transglycosylase RlpA family protein [Rufibacter sp. XAAS-G3-1]